MSTCQARVWDNGDTTDCGAPTEPRTRFCRLCGNARRDRLRKAIRDQILALESARDEMRILNLELGYERESGTSG